MTKIINKNSPVFGKTITIEFYVDSDKNLHAIYNLQNYSFLKFWKTVPYADEICRVIFMQFDHQFPEQLKNQKHDSKSWCEIFIKFVNSHLRDYDHIMDVVIKSNGTVEINLER